MANIKNEKPFYNFQYKTDFFLLCKNARVFINFFLPEKVIFPHSSEMDLNQWEKNPEKCQFFSHFDTIW